MNISTVAKQSGLPPKTIRYYDPSDIYKLKFLQRAQSRLLCLGLQVVALAL